MTLQKGRSETIKDTVPNKRRMSMCGMAVMWYGGMACAIARENE